MERRPLILTALEGDGELRRLQCANLFTAESRFVIDATHRPGIRLGSVVDYVKRPNE
jgi:hypothetical protein